MSYLGILIFALIVASVTIIALAATGNWGSTGGGSQLSTSAVTTAPQNSYSIKSGTETLWQQVPGQYFTYTVSGKLRILSLSINFNLQAPLTDSTLPLILVLSEDFSSATLTVIPDNSDMTNLFPGGTYNNLVCDKSGQREMQMLYSVGNVASTNYLTGAVLTVGLQQTLTLTLVYEISEV